MTDINTIISDNFDTDICTKPDIIDDSKMSRRGFQRVISTRIASSIDEIEGIMRRQFFQKDSYDGYICWIISTTEADARNIIKATKKICATFVPIPGQENILQWEGGEWTPFNNVRFIFRFVILKRKSGMQAY